MNTSVLTLIPPQSDLTSTRLADVHLQSASFPEFPFSVSKPVINRMLLKNLFFLHFKQRNSIFIYLIKSGSDFQVEYCPVVQRLLQKKNQSKVKEPGKKKKENRKL